MGLRAQRVISIIVLSMFARKMKMIISDGRIDALIFFLKDGTCETIGNTIIFPLVTD